MKDEQVIDGICDNCKTSKADMYHLGMNLCKPCSKRIDQSFDGIKEGMRRINDRNALENCTHKTNNGMPIYTDNNCRWEWGSKP